MSESISWTSADGAYIDLSGPDYQHLDGKVGRFFPGAEITSVSRVQGPGSVIQRARHTARVVTLPILVRGASSADVRAKVRALVAAFDPVRGDGRLTVVTVVGDTRVLRCRYVEGFEGVESWDTRSTVRQQFVADFLAADPYWSDVVGETFTLTAGDEAVSAWFPFLPMTLLASELIASGSIVNAGDVDVWPTITVRGPVIDPVLRNESTGQSLALSATLAAGQWITLDASPTARTVVDQDGANMYPALTSREWWPIKRGGNTLIMSGSGTLPTTSVDVTWARGYLSV